MQSIWFLLMGDLMSYKKLSASNNKMRTLNFEDERLMIWTWNHQARTLVHATHNLVNILFFFSLFFFCSMPHWLGHIEQPQETHFPCHHHTFCSFGCHIIKTGTYFSEVTFEQKTKERERKKTRSNMNTFGINPFDAPWAELIEDDWFPMTVVQPGECYATWVFVLKLWILIGSPGETFKLSGRACFVLAGIIFHIFCSVYKLCMHHLASDLRQGQREGLAHRVIFVSHYRSQIANIWMRWLVRTRSTAASFTPFIMLGAHWSVSRGLW